MLAILANPVFARLFSAQCIALVGTGLLTVALGLLAYDIAGTGAGAVLGTAFAIKMVAYVGLAPLANAAADRLPRKAVLIGADLIRAVVALALPFVDAVWQIYLLIFVLQAASATFTPTFQATIPDLFESEADYTRALSLSRLAYDLENLLSPALAGVLLLVTGYHNLFLGTVVGFAGSALMVASVALPLRKAATRTRSFAERATRGLRIYMATPRLRGLLGLSMAAAATSAFVLVNTVVLVRAGFGGAETQVAVALACYGAGSMLAALVLPQLLDHMPDRPVMVTAGTAVTLWTVVLGLWTWLAGLPAWPVFLALWALGGFLYSAILTPSGRLLRRSARPEDRPALFTAQFTLSHACWLIAYPVAGIGGEALGMPATLLILGAMGLAGAVLAHMTWPPHDPESLAHDHPDLAPGHPHLEADGQGGHRHAFVIDDEHRRWPSPPRARRTAPER
ncbi:MFS transporter [Chachezhania sediminis]|uniref:MFS transporter n=1 Tax=Chachezhania sediminis TaxID=2599291 RepID=UPI00131DDABA|nr:MFS transporter [Chachezhania sediminis]